MVENVVTTGVDALLNLLHKEERIALFDAAKKLHVPGNTVQSWVDFLVEEHIVGIEYKFTKPYIYLNRAEKKDKKQEKKEKDALADLKKDYFARAKSKKIPEDKIPQLWQSHLRHELASLQSYFYEQATRRGVQSKEQQHNLWSEYHQSLLKKIQEIGQ